MKLSRILSSLALASMFALAPSGECSPKKSNPKILIKDGLLVRSFLVNADDIKELGEARGGVVSDPIAIAAIRQRGTQAVQNETYNFGEHYMDMNSIKPKTYTFRRKPVMFATWQDIKVAIGETIRKGQRLLVPEERRFDYDYRMTSPKTSEGSLHIDLNVSTLSPGTGWFNTQTRTRRILNVPVNLSEPHDIWFVIPQKSNLDGTHRVLLMGLEPLSRVDMASVKNQR